MPNLLTNSHWFSSVVSFHQKSAATRMTIPPIIAQPLAGNGFKYVDFVVFEVCLLFFAIRLQKYEKMSIGIYLVA